MALWRVLGAPLVLAMALTTAACESIKAPPGITCLKLRALRIGMTVEEVRAILGPAAFDGRYEGTNPEFDRTTNYTVGAVRLIAAYFNNHLVEVDSYIRTLWRELTGRYDDGRPTLFLLSKDQRREGPEFERVYCHSR